MTRLESDDCSYMGSHPVRAHEVLRHCVPMFEDRGPVLELGCGPGEFLHHGRRGRVTEHHHDPEWAYELAHVVKVLAGRLQETTDTLREVRRAHDKLAWGLYQATRPTSSPGADPGPGDPGS